MFKNLLVLSISLLTLVGCQERQKVTAEMLEGTWDCKVDNSRGTSYHYYDSKLKGIQSYTLNNTGYVAFIKKQEEGFEVETKYYAFIAPISPDDNYAKLNGAIECESIDQINNIITEIEYKFISKDELKESSFTKYEHCDPRRTFMEFNIEATCKRVP